MTFQIFVTKSALKMLQSISDRRIQLKIRADIKGLSANPEQQGKPLTGELGTFRSLRSVGQRYRIIYRVEQKKVTVLVVGVGLRKEGSKKDIYALAKKLIRLKLV